MSAYQGDLSPSPFAASDLGIVAGITYRQFFHPRYAFKIAGAFTQISGSDMPYAAREDRGLEMDGSLMEFTVNAEWHILGSSRFSNVGAFSRQFSPYVSIGMGVARANAEVGYAGSASTMKEENDVSTFFIVPINVGIRFEMTKAITLTLDVGTRPVFSDYLDGVSRMGADHTNDWYTMGGLTFLYTFQADADGHY
ncbi:MAG: hypothetical protein F6K19_13510 [Cyanothece sp. SIO1E1]|nr:hypothetical protein [Cyanothece sp. SIO1E1]